MTIALPEVRIGDPVCHEALSVFPLFTESDGEVEYRLAGDAIEDGSVIVEEISESGSVPDLQVENKGDLRVLFLEGEELVGAKQNRILNTSLLVAAGAKVKVPVSCVEQGRWRYQSRQFRSSDGISPSEVRHAMKSSVARSLKEKRGYGSDQGEVWKKISLLHRKRGVSSPTGAMSDAFEQLSKDVEACREKIQYVDGAVGLAAAIGETIVAVDLFDKPTTCQSVWSRLISGMAVEAMESEAKDRPSLEAVEGLLASARSADWEPVEPIGEGDQYRAEFAKEHASALSLEGSLIHESVLAEQVS